LILELNQVEVAAMIGCDEMWVVNREKGHPEVADIHYHLACYESQLGDIEVAKARLRHTIALDPGFHGRALDDEDMEPLWDSLRW
jgi:hypothetical protein